MHYTPKEYDSSQHTFKEYFVSEIKNAHEFVSKCTDEELLLFIDEQIGNVFLENINAFIGSLNPQMYTILAPICFSIIEKGIPYIKENLEESRQFFKLAYNMIINN